MRTPSYSSKKTFAQRGTGHGQLGRYYVLHDKGGRIMAAASREGPRKNRTNTRNDRRKHGRGY